MFILFNITKLLKISIIYCEITIVQKLFYIETIYRLLTKIPLWATHSPLIVNLIEYIPIKYGEINYYKRKL